jgi:hypothetical protein
MSFERKSSGPVLTRFRISANNFFSATLGDIFVPQNLDLTCFTKSQSYKKTDMMLNTYIF